MRHPNSGPLPCDPNRESPPSLITCKGEFLPLGSHCETGTLTRDKALKSRIFFAKTYLIVIVLKHEENLFEKSFFSISFSMIDANNIVC